MAAIKNHIKESEAGMRRFFLEEVTRALRLLTSQVWKGMKNEKHKELMKCPS